MHGHMNGKKTFLYKKCNFITKKKIGPTVNEGNEIAHNGFLDIIGYKRYKRHKTYH